jgi:hypothetical protein
VGRFTKSAAEAAIGSTAVAVCLKAYPDTNPEINEFRRYESRDTNPEFFS